MGQLLERFYETLSAEREVHKELLTLSTQKKEAIIQNDIPSLDRIVKGEEILLSRLNQWEKKRKDCVQTIASQVGRPAQEIVWQDFLPAGDSAQRERLMTLHRDLKSLLEEQIAVNDINKRLIESRLEYIDYSLETIAGEGQGAYQTYGGGGQGSGRPARKTSIIDQKV
jgi:flagellar biosynthesis/type III secretory pathway chaperone